ncbi:hypothetical protein FRB90_010127, partial [Tulasnella sp. 427]
TFGYMPPDLNPRQLKEYRRLQRNKARALGRRKAEAARAEAAAIEAAVAEGESTGAEGDEEPETETDHDPHLSLSSSQMSMPSAVSGFTPASAIDALFTKSLGANNSSPDTSALSPAKKGPKAAKTTKSPRPKPAPTDPPTNQESEVARERAHFANLMQSLALSQPSATPSSSQAVPSGLPTPADSPVVPMSRTTTSGSTHSDVSSLTATGKPTSSNQKSIFDFVSPFDALADSSPPKKKGVPTRPIVAATPSWSSAASRPSSILTSGSESFQSAASSEELGDMSTTSEDDDGLDDSDTVAPVPEAPATLTIPTQAGGMMHRALNSAGPGKASSSIASQRVPTPDTALQFTPKAKQPAVMEDMSLPPHPATGRMPASSSQAQHSLASHSTGSTSMTGQHLALLEMVATEADAIATHPNAQTPHAAPVSLPPATGGNLGTRMAPQPGVINPNAQHYSTAPVAQAFVANHGLRGPLNNAIGTEPYDI